MKTLNFSKSYTLTGIDKQILQKPHIVDWLAALEKEFALHRCKKSTSRSYRGWIIDFILWKYRSHCLEVAEGAMRAYLTWLVETRHVAASTQDQAFNALLFFYRHVMKQEPGKVEAARAKRHKYIPVVLPREDVARLIAHSSGIYRLINSLMYGCALRVEID